MRLLIHPLGGARLPRGEALREPERNLLLSGGGGVAAVEQVAPDIECKVKTDGAGGGVGGLGGTQQLAADSGCVLALPRHGDDGARSHVGDQTGEETLGLQVGVVLQGG